jgi:ADP-ribosylglycohydrolase/protein-tyrosine phosphatase
LTFCPGKKQQQSLTGGWNRDLDIDLDAIEAWGADIVISLLESFEYAELDVDTLPAQFDRRFRLWLDLPMVDKMAPDATWMRAWRLLRVVLAQSLYDGARILIHCKGGMGRTGTVAAMILHDLGMPMPEAIRQVRAAREGTVETAIQEEFLASYRISTIGENAARCASSLLAGALGDAIGGPLEFIDHQTIERQFPARIRSLLAGDAALEITDDTQMTLYTLAGLLDAPAPELRFAAVRTAYLAWYAGQMQTALPSLPAAATWTRLLLSTPTVNKMQAPGQTCLSALAAGGNGTLAAPPNQSKGCGAVMRFAPFAWLAHSAGEAAALSEQTALITHGHTLGYQPAGLAASLLWHRLHDAKSLADTLRNMLADRRGIDELLGDLLQWAVEFGDKASAPRRHPQLLGEGWIGEEALAIALCHAIRGEANAIELSTLLWDAAAHDGDSDSTAAIAGNFAVAPLWDGDSMEALARIDALDTLLDFAEALCARIR